MGRAVAVDRALPPPADAPAQRCFIALRPDAPARAALDALARAQQGLHPGSRRVARENLHLTLAFIGPLAAARARAVALALRAVRAPAFAWTIDGCGGFEGARVLWAGAGHDDPRLEALARKVRRVLDALDVAYDPKPFRAHVTLLRQVARARAPASCRPIAWRVTAPVLMVSARDAREVLRYRPWGGPRDGPRA